VAARQALGGTEGASEGGAPEGGPAGSVQNVREAAARAAAAVDGEGVIALARQLVRIRSVVDEEAGTTEAACAEAIAGYLRGLGLEPVVQEVVAGRPNVICDWSGRGFDPARHRTLMLEGHTDVVTEGERSRWRFDPFAGEVVAGDDGERLYGRGSADMKGGVAAAIGALAALMRSSPELPLRVRLGIVVDEEGMMLGIKDFIARGWADEVDGAIICEPEEGELCLVQKGAMRVHVRVQGVMAHGAMPYAGVNPIVGLTRFLALVQELQEREQGRLGPHEHLGLPWCTPTIVRAPVRGEAQLNVMPDEAYAALDIRTIPGQEHDALYAELRAAADRVEGAMPRLTIALDWFESRPSTETPADDPLVRALEAVYPLVFGRPPRYGGVPGATDGTFLRATAGVPIVTVGPGDRTIPHQVDEFVRLADVVDAARLYAAAAVAYAGMQT
jgi:succinyl-diaminopimelate desuccinylase